LLPLRHLIFTAVEGALTDPRTDSFSGAEDALAEIARKGIPLILLTSRTRAEIEPLRRKLEHTHPFVAENGGGIFFPDGYFNLRIPGAVRAGRYLAIAQGRPYKDVCAALDEIAEECGVGVTGFHHMNLREIAENTGLRPRQAELARAREFDEPFFFTSASDRDIARFVAAVRNRGFDTRRGATFWHFSSGCDTARAVRTISGIFRQATHTKLRLIGVGAGKEDLNWLGTVDAAIQLPDSPNAPRPPDDSAKALVRGKIIIAGSAPGPVGWSDAILNIIG